MVGFRLLGLGMVGFRLLGLAMVGFRLLGLAMVGFTNYLGICWGKNIHSWIYERALSFICTMLEDFGKITALW